MWIVQAIIILPRFFIVRLSRAVAIRVGKVMKNSSQRERHDP